MLGHESTGCAVGSCHYASHPGYALKIMTRSYVIPDLTTSNCCGRTVLSRSDVLLNSHHWLGRAKCRTEPQSAVGVGIERAIQLQSAGGPSVLHARRSAEGGATAAATVTQCRHACLQWLLSGVWEFLNWLQYLVGTTFGTRRVGVCKGSVGHLQPCMRMQ